MLMRGSFVVPDMTEQGLVQVPQIVTHVVVVVFVVNKIATNFVVVVFL